MSASEIPFVPVRASLYSADELLSPATPKTPGDYVATADFRIYRHFVANGKAVPKDSYVRLMQSVHDNSISEAALRLLAAHDRVVAIMGGHKMKRGSADYEKVVMIARLLANNGALLVSGGGPGAMEATHLGAAMKNSSDADVAAAIRSLARVAEMPSNAAAMVDAKGNVDMAAVTAVFEWLKPALEVRESIAQPGDSLGVPTWYYGHEPFTPFASDIAKYFQNSLREDGLLAMAAGGVIYAEGKAGTIQEVFQDAAQNYYKTLGGFSPMVLLGEKYWSETYPVYPLLAALFMNNNLEAEFRKKVKITDDAGDVVTFLMSFPPNQARLVENLVRLSAPRRNLGGK